MAWSMMRHDGCVILCAHAPPFKINTSTPSPGQVYSAIEVFAGVATLSRCLQIAGYNTASLDITYWSPWIEQRKCKRLRKLCKGNPLDLLSPAGFALFGAFIVLFSFTGEPIFSAFDSKTCNALKFMQQLRLLLSTIMRAKDGVVVTFGLLCSTWVSISRGSTFRSYFLPEGDQTAPSVAMSNLLAARNGLC